MLVRTASWLIYFVVMTVMICVSVVFVLFLYVPFVMLKAVWLAANGRLHETTGPRSGDEKSATHEA